MLTVGKDGCAYGHFVLPFGEIPSNLSVLRHLLVEKAGELGLAPRLWNDIGHSVNLASEALQISGQCDILLRLSTDDFRFVYFFQSLLSQGVTLRDHSGAANAGSKHPLEMTPQASGWLFSVPYSGPTVVNPVGAIRFTIYLRVRRFVYRFFGARAEKQIVHAIQDLVTRSNGVSAAVHYSLGWPDLILDGSFSCSVGEFVGFLLDLQALHIRSTNELARRPGGDASNFPVFRKSITLAGFTVPDWPATGVGTEVSRPSVRPLVYLRSYPGSFRDAARDVVECLGDGLSLAAFSIDGKWDAVLLPQPGNSNGLSVEELYRSFRDQHELLFSSGVERTQTHVLLTPVDEVPQRVPVDELSLDNLSNRRPDAGDTCSCREEKFSAAILLTQTQAAAEGGYLPAALMRTLSDTLSLFRFALRDRTNCCDARQALLACAKGLLVLLGKMKQAHDRIEEIRQDPTRSQLDDESEWTFEQLEDLWRNAESWCGLAGRVLRERTAGSFEDLFNPSVSLPAIRGGLQKLLYVADNLLQEFYEQYQSSLRQESIAEGSFSTIYEPSSTIKSERYLGIIKIPVSYAFTLHMVVPQLWHEVGQYIFSQRYHPFSPRIERRMRDLKQRSSTTPATALWKDAADMYADLVVLHYGFLGKYEQFQPYLTTFFLDALRHNNPPAHQKQRQLVRLAERLYFAYQFKIIAPSVVGKGASRTRLAEIDKELEAFRESPKGILEHVIAPELQRTAEAWARDLRRTRRSEPLAVKLDEAFLERALQDVTSEEFKHFHVPLMRELLLVLSDSIPRPVEFPTNRLANLERGEVVNFDLGESVNGYYHAVYWKEIRSRILGGLPTSGQSPKAPRMSSSGPTFRELAALTRSAQLLFHKRQAVREEKKRSQRISGSS